MSYPKISLDFFLEIILPELNNSALFVSSCVGSENPNSPNCVGDGILFKPGRSMAFMWEQRWTGSIGMP